MKNIFYRNSILVSICFVSALLLISCGSSTDRTGSQTSTYSLDLIYEMEPEELDVQDRWNLIKNLDTGDMVRLVVSELELFAQMTPEQMNVWNDNYNAIGYHDEKGELWVTIYENKGTKRQEIVNIKASEIDSLEQPVLTEISYQVIAIIKWTVEFIFKLFDLESEYPG